MALASRSPLLSTWYAAFRSRTATFVLPGLLALAACGGVALVPVLTPPPSPAPPVGMSGAMPPVADDTEQFLVTPCTGFRRGDCFRLSGQRTGQVTVAHGTVNMAADGQRRDGY